MTSTHLSLAELGWTPHFANQIDADDPRPPLAARVLAVHRDRLQLAGAGVDRACAPFAADPDDPESAATVGDWLLLDPETLRPRRLLARSSLFKRRAAGTGRRLQLIAANVDTLFVVSSCNQDFNPARLERYLALAREAGVMPVVVLTKADLTDTPEDFTQAAAKLLPGLLVEAVDAREPHQIAHLLPWCAGGRTVALVGSSGVGKSTLVNTLAGGAGIATRPIREDDDRGRHTTTARTMHRLAAGGWLVDTPGMRELALADAAAGIDDVFADIVAIAAGCRFADCRHDTEPGCAVNAAIASDDLDASRVRRWRKLAAEETRNSEDVARRHARERAFGRLVREAMDAKRRRRGE